MQSLISCKDSFCGHTFYFLISIKQWLCCLVIVSSISNCDFFFNLGLLILVVIANIANIANIASFKFDGYNQMYRIVSYLFNSFVVILLGNSLKTTSREYNYFLYWKMTTTKQQNTFQILKQCKALKHVCLMESQCR